MARILPLEGKYYGTKISLNDEDEIVIWCPDHFALPFASAREIANGWQPADGHDHVEDQKSYRLAEIVCAALTEAGF